MDKNKNVVARSKLSQSPERSEGDETISKDVIASPPARNDLPELPKGWVWTSLGNVITFEYGKGLREDKRDRDGNTPVYGSNGVVGYHSDPLIEKPCLIVGRKGSAGHVHLSRGPCWAIDTTYYVIPPEGIGLSFLYYLLSTLQLGSLDKSTAIPGLNRNDVYSLTIPLPPFPEQHRIVAKIEELFTKLDAGVEALKKVKAQLKRYRQAVLKYAFEGRLTEEWRQSELRNPNSALKKEPASVLLEQIKEERKKNAKGKYREMPPVDTSDLPELPEGWVWTTVSQVTTKVTDGVHKTPKYVDNGIPFISVNNMSKNGTLSFYPCKFITLEEHQEFYKHCNPEKGDVLLSKVGTVGLTSVINTDKEFSLFVNTALIKPLPNMISPEFLAFILRYGFLSDFYNSFISGSTQKLIGTTKIGLLPIPLASFEEQKEIVKEIERLFSVAEEVEKVVQLSLKQAERLRQSILKKTFEGKLVPQDPTDEPAEKLLERIKLGKKRGMG